MITPKQIEEATMSPEKRAMAQNDFFAFYIGRPLSYILTIPFLYSSLTPNQVTFLSLFPLFVGLVLMYLGTDTYWFVIGWACFFLWNLLDGVDGNMARYRKQFSTMGSVWDAMVGYVAMVFQPLAWGIAAFHFPGMISEILSIPVDLLLIMGALSGVFAIFPRLVMHKTISTLGTSKKTDSVKDKSNFSLLKVIALNLTSATGFMQVFMLLSIFFDMFDLFTIAYLVMNGGVMLLSLWSILKTK